MLSSPYRLSAAPSVRTPGFNWGLFLAHAAQGLIASYVVLIGVVSPLAGCQQLQAAFPVLDKVEAVVAADFEAGDSDETIAADVCKALGGTASTDAVCANVTQLVSDAVAFLVDSGFLSAKAKANAIAYQGRHPKLSKSP
jgi:hypothetical protein